MGQRGKTSREVNRELARLQLKKKKEIMHERTERSNKEKDHFYSLPLKDRVNRFYSFLPTKKAKRLFWIASPIILLLLTVKSVLYCIKYPVLETWARDLHTVIFKVK